MAQGGAGAPGSGGAGEQEASVEAGEQGSGGDGEAGQAGGTDGGQGQTPGGPGPGGGHVESVFVPAPAELAGEGEEMELETQCLGDPAACGPLGQESPAGFGQPGGSVVPYDQVFGDYRDAAIEALSGGAIPLGLESLVRDYFSSLEP
ncbi:hypothetical protein [Promineifilum sp.]|uniref:hypothetical protein n=1 Tax=Promineifilum sp. TaxID=2664178 RepID=UPI0035B3BCC3